MEDMRKIRHWRNYSFPSRGKKYLREETGREAELFARSRSSALGTVAIG
ncbi:hypothetical protein NPIL_22301, partial [Nephila pilipes]